MPPKSSVIKSVAVASVSTLMVVGVGLVVTLSGADVPGVTDLAHEQRVSGSTLSEQPPVPASAETSETDQAEHVADPVEDSAQELTPAEQAMNDLVASVEDEVAKAPVARTTTGSTSTATSATAPAPAPAPAARESTTPYSFQIAAFNVLGSNHTKPGGGTRGFAPGRLRAQWAARYVVDHGLDIVGWSEIQPDQHSAVNSATGGAFEFWPGSALGYKGTPASLMWRTSQFTAVWKGTVTIPFVGQQRPMPVVQLEEIATGRQFFVMNVHNAPREREAERNAAEAKEIDLVRTLRRESGLPVFFLGDFNEKAEIFCTVTSKTDLLSASGGSNSGGVCRPPSGMRVDWLFGSPDAAFSGYIADRGPSVRRITDHAVIRATATVG